MQTAARRAEVLGLRREDIDFAANQITFSHNLLYTPNNGIYLQPRLKTQDEKKLFVNDELLKMIGNYLAELDTLFEIADGAIPYSDMLFISVKNSKYCKPGGLPFPDAYSDWFQGFVKRNNLPPISFHKLRHSSISYLLNNGVDPYVVMKIAGHSSLEQITKTYGHLYDRSQREAMANFNMLNRDVRDRQKQTGINHFIKI